MRLRFPSLETLDHYRWHIVATILTVSTAACSVRTVEVNAGEAAVLVDRPHLPGHGGVRPGAVHTGRTWILFSADAIKVNLQPIQFSEHPVSLIASFGQAWSPTTFRPSSATVSASTA
jgi:hypothetical protein